MLLDRLLFFTILLSFVVNCYGQNQAIETTNTVNYIGFLRLGDSLSTYRQSRLIDYQTFKEYAKEENTIILDSRSKKAFDEIHLCGAVHINFSEFTEDKLRKIIPEKTTRILIYCNNNFQSELPALLNKSPALALNVPTFINLYGYGYKNIYELEGYWSEEDLKMDFEYGEK